MVWSRFFNGILLLLFFIVQSIYVLQNPFWDYDSVVHFQIAQEIAEGNFSRVFQHAAPLAHLVYGLGFIFLKQKLVLLSVMMTTLGIWLISTLLINQYHKDWQDKPWMLTLPFVSSFLFVHLSNQIGIEPGTLLLFAFWWYYLTKWMKDNSRIGLIVFSGIIILWNYKMVALLGFLGLLIFINRNHQWRQNVIMFLSVSWVLIFTSLLSLLAKLPILQYVKVFIAIIFNRSEITSGNSSVLKLSLFSHSYYVAYWESFWCIAGIVAMLYFVYQHTLNSKKHPLYLLILFSFYWIFVISILPSAPRVLSILIPFLLFIGLHGACVVIQRIIQKSKLQQSALTAYSILFLTILASVAWQWSKIKTHYMEYQPSGYVTMTSQIRHHMPKGDTLYVTCSNGIIPYLKAEDQIPIKVLLTMDEYLKVPTGAWVLFDIESRYNGWQDFVPTPDRVFATIDNPCRREMMLGFENAEYAGLNYHQVLKIKDDSERLKMDDLILYQK
ncbi:MAG: hypothetical protein U0U66_04590 [Cytophagaceae bacterium]